MSRNEREYWIGRKGRTKYSGTSLEGKVELMLNSRGWDIRGSAPDELVESGKYVGEWALRPDFVLTNGTVVAVHGIRHDTARMRRNFRLQVEAYNAAGHNVVVVWYTGLDTVGHRETTEQELDEALRAGKDFAEVGQ